MHVESIQIIHGGYQWRPQTAGRFFPQSNPNATRNAIPIPPGPQLPATGIHKGGQLYRKQEPLPATCLGNKYKFPPRLHPNCDIAQPANSSDMDKYKIS